MCFTRSKNSAITQLEATILKLLLHAKFQVHLATQRTHFEINWPLELSKQHDCGNKKLHFGKLLTQTVPTSNVKRYPIVRLYKLSAALQQERCSRGGKICFWGGQNFWVGLVFTKFSVDLKKKKKVIAPIWSTFFRVLCWFPKKKATILKLPQEKGKLGGHAGQFGGGQNFCSGERHPLLPLPPSRGSDFPLASKWRSGISFSD